MTLLILAHGCDPTGGGVDVVAADQAKGLEDSNRRLQIHP